MRLCIVFFGNIFLLFSTSKMPPSERGYAEKCLRGMPRPAAQYISMTYAVHSCQDTLAEIVHTKDGSRVVREFIAQGTAKVSRASCILSDMRS